MKKILNFITAIIMLFVFIGTIAIALDFIEIIDLPDMLSVRTIITKKNEEEKAKIIDKIAYKDEIDYRILNNQISYESQKHLSENIEEKQEYRFYYEQLPDEAQKIYQKIYDNKEKIRTGLYTVDYGETFDELLHTEGGSEKLSEYYQLAINALSYDNPEIFFIVPEKMFLLTASITFKVTNFVKYKVYIGPNNDESYLQPQFGNEQNINTAIDKLRTIKFDVAEKAKTKGPIKEQIRYVHDYIVNNVTYDSTLEKENIYDAYGALVNGEAVCEGYAKAFKYILDEMGIPCIIVCGTARNHQGVVEDHAWNYVKIDEIWYAVDVTWDDPIILGGGIVSDKQRYSNFLVGREEFEEEHKANGMIIGDYFEFQYPQLHLLGY